MPLLTLDCSGADSNLGMTGLTGWDVAERVPARAVQEALAASTRMLDSVF